MKKVTVNARNLVTGDILLDEKGRNRRIKNVHTHSHYVKGKGDLTRVYAVVVDRNARGLELVPFTAEQRVKIKRANSVNSKLVNNSRKRLGKSIA